MQPAYIPDIKRIQVWKYFHVHLFWHQKQRMLFRGRWTLFRITIESAALSREVRPTVVRGAKVMKGSEVVVGGVQVNVIRVRVVDKVVKLEVVVDVIKMFHF